MKKNLIKRATIIFLTLITITGLFLQGIGCNSPSQYISVTLQFSESPRLGKEVELTATFSLSGKVYKEASGVKTEILLPEGIEKVAGDLQFQQDFVSGTTYELKATVKTIKTGLWEVVANAFFSPGEGAYLGGTKELWVNVSENDATVSDSPPRPTGIPQISGIQPPTSNTNIPSDPQVR